MRKIVLLQKRFLLTGIMLIPLLALQIIAQHVINGTSTPKNFKMQVAFERGLPPNLFADLQFSDENGNGIIEANEKAELKLTITNKGKGAAQGLKIKVADELNSDNEFKIDGEREVYYILPDKSVEIKVPLSAGFDIHSAEHKLKITVLENFGYDMDPAFLVLNTLEYQAPKIAFSGYEVVDYGESTAAITEDGQIQPGEQVKVKVFVQNTGQNLAKNVRYTVSTSDPNIFVDGKTGTLPDMSIGEVKFFWITVSPNKRVDPAKKLPVFLSVDLDKGKGSLNNYPMALAMNQKPPETKVLQVNADMDKLRSQVARFEYTSNKFTANVGQMINIREVPAAATKRDNAVAVVFGIEKYDELPPAPYAENDANIVKEYFQNLLGINKVVTYTSSQARGLIFDDVFNPDYGELQKAIAKGQTDVFVFYSGHGIPSKTGEQIFLFPSDGKIARTEVQGYDLNKLYENLEKLGARSVTVFLDACFSGASRQSEKIQTENLVSMKGIRVVPKLLQPWETNPTFSVLTSSSAEETSLALDASQTGLFTYYMCAGLQGNADINADKTITLGELYQYIKEEVMSTSKKISGIQTPDFHGNPETILVQY
jgi:hypothetical protein